MTTSSGLTAGTKAFSLAISVSLFFITVAAFLRPPLLPAIGRDLNLSAVGLGALGSVFAVGRLLADVPAGRLSDRIHAGPMMLIASALVAIGSLAFALAPGAALAFAAVLVLGAGSTWTLTTAQAHFATAPKARRGAAMSVFAGSLLTGQALGPVLGGAVGSLASWRFAIGVGAVLAILVSLPFVRMPGPPPGNREDEAVDGDGDSAGPMVLAFVYLLPAVQFAIGAALVQTLVPIVADIEIGIGVGAVGVALGVGGLARLVGAVIAGRVMDRHGRRIALIPGLSMQLAGVVVFAAWPGLWAMWVTILLVSFGSISVNVGTALLADLSEGGRLGPRLGAFRFTGDAAFLVAPLLVGWLLDGHGRTVATLPLAVFTAFVLVGAAVLVPETHRVER